MQFAICNLPLRAEHPELLSTPTAAEAQRTGYSRGHAGKFVHWVEGTLTPHQVAAPTVERLSSFLVDRDQPREYRWSPSDYDGTPYDIGHLWPAAFAHSAVGERDSFLMTNTMPQAVGLNRGQWARLEAFTAQRVAGGDTAAIDAGP
ncbi:MAG: DNA/RNA non-specific endonuclease, partial [Bradyrhizobium sp.]|nr:DNA/RNA non-specific endonuclease [Bradyrhizobium sp.]